MTELSGPGGMTRSSSVLRLKYPNTKSKLSSGFLIQPSRYGAMFRPDANLMSGIHVGGTDGFWAWTRWVAIARAATAAQVTAPACFLIEALRAPLSRTAGPPHVDRNPTDRDTSD